MRLDHVVFQGVSKKRQSQIFLILGPALVVLSMLFLLLKASFFLMLIASFSCGGIILTWKYALKGAVFSIATLLSVLLVFRLFFDKELVAFELLGILSFATSLMIMGFSFIEHKRAEDDISQERDASISLLQRGYEHQLNNLERMNEEIKSELESKNLSIHTLHHKVKETEEFKASLKDEYNHYLLQIEKLKNETLELQRQLFEVDAKKIDFLQLEALYQKNLRELNTIRVDYYQQRLLLEHARDHGLLKNESERLVEAPDVSSVTDINVLEEERSSLKKYYKQQLRDYKGIQEKLRALFSIDVMDEETTSYLGFPEYYANLKSSFQEMTKHLQETRVEIFKTEGHIIAIQNAQPAVTDQGSTSSQNYLAIADQECLRLEEENTMLLDLIESLFIAYTKKTGSVD